MEKKDFIICVDMDDTIEDLTIAWVEWLNSKYTLSININNIMEWDMTHNFPMLTAEEIYAPLTDKEFWKTVKAKKDAIYYLDKLNTEGYSIYICTNSFYKNLQNKFDSVLFNNFPFISPSQLIILKHKQMIKCDVLVDDYYNNLIEADYNGILFTAPHNKNIDEDSLISKYPIVRANNWEEVYNRITDLYERRL